MKKTLTLTLFLLVSSVMYAQDLTQEPILSDGQRTWLNIQGIPITTYDWKNPQINKDLNLALDYRKKSIWYSVGAWTAISLGIVVAGNGYAKAKLQDDATGLVIGGLMLTGSIPLFIFSGKNKKKSSVHISNAAKALRE